MSSHTYNLTANLPKLVEEIEAGTFASSLLGIASEVQGDSTRNVTVEASPDLTAGEITELDGIIAAHNPTAATIAQKIDAARTFGVSMINQYQAKMIGEGITVVGDPHAMHVKLERSLVMAQAGNLYALEAELATLATTTTFLEQSRIDSMRNEVRAYLGKPLLWDAATTYEIGDQAHHNGADYEASAQNTNDAPPSANWTAL